jgi:hypothetical protein
VLQHFVSRIGIAHEKSRPPRGLEEETFWTFATPLPRWLRRGKGASPGLSDSQCKAMGCAGALLQEEEGEGAAAPHTFTLTDPQTLHDPHASGSGLHVQHGTAW